MLNGTAINCAILHNFATQGAAGAMAQSSHPTSPQMVPVNCTVAWNTIVGILLKAGIKNCVASNTICYFNTPEDIDAPSTRLYSSCTVSLTSVTGADNITDNPQFLSDGVHLSESSPCRNAGTTNVIGALDIDGQSWSGTPSIGCDEWHPEPVIAKCPFVTQGEDFDVVEVRLSVAGENPFGVQWRKNGNPLLSGPKYLNSETTSLGIRNFDASDAGDYSFVVTNASGSAAGQVSINVHHVNPSSSSPAPPYQDWNMAAQDIQTAVDFASPQSVILVTNGVYAIGGFAVTQGQTNRVVVDKAVLVKSINGSADTIIEGQWDPVSTNGPMSVRCVWLANDATLSGFTLRNGSTIAGPQLVSGGGSSDLSTNSVVSHSIITNCISRSGGGVYQCQVNYSTICGNSAEVGGGLRHSAAYRSIIRSNWGGVGGGAHASHLAQSSIIFNRTTSRGGGLDQGSAVNCFIEHNTSDTVGGGSWGANLVHCTVSRNFAPSGSGILGGRIANVIVALNSGGEQVNFLNSSSNSCLPTDSLVSPSNGTILADPMLVNGYHLAAGSPCVGAGDPAYSTGSDLDGEPWLNPPSMGCDEFYAAGITGALAVALSSGYPEVAEHGAMPLTGEITGRASSLEWDFGDGVTSSNLSYFTSHIWTNAGDYPVTFTAYNSDNPTGVSTNLLVHVVPLELPQLSGGSFTNTSFSVEFSGQPGVSYDIERATNLIPPVVWQRLTTRLSDGSVIQYTDTKATNAMQFYRATVQ